MSTLATISICDVTVFRNRFCSLSVSANNAMALASWLWYCYKYNVQS